MKGTVVSVWLNTIEKVWGKEVKHKAMSSAGWDENKMISPLDDIRDEEIFAIVRNVGTSTGTDYRKVWSIIGQNNIDEFAKWFPSYFERSSLKSFIMMMDKVHAQLTKMIKGAVPPRLIPEEIDDRTFIITYESKRGLTDYMLGLLMGSAKYFNEKMDYEILEEGKTPEGKTYMKVKIRTEKGTLNTKIYGFSKFISFGFMRSIPIKTAALPTVAVFITAMATTGFDLVPAFSSAIVVFAVTYIASKSLGEPVAYARTEIDKLVNHNFEDNIIVRTGDSHEMTFVKINELRDKLKEDFVFIKGGIDDIHNFNRKFSQVAENMNSVSSMISSNVKEVAEGASHQAIETENSVAILSDNMKILNALSQEEIERKVQLEDAIKDIEESFRELQDVAQGLGLVKDNFAEVNMQGQNLSKKVNEIISIVSTVENIAEQTNLLALNASIEAARAGDMGRGFSVVAEEIRKLAEDSKVAVNTINTNLKHFIGDVNSMTVRVSDQFGELEVGNKRLGMVATKNQAATNKIGDVAEGIVELSDKLYDQTKKISSVFDNMNTLAAIAQQNSASTQEMSANVMEFTDEIGTFSDYIGELEKLSVNMRTELKKYRL
jgi:methyl-accepting chemotaxis protein